MISPIVQRHYPRSDHIHYWHVAIIKRRNRVVSIGVNTGWNHAEEDAIGKLRRYPHLLKGATLYSYRVGKNGHLRNAKPCEKCEALIRSVGIELIVYSDANGIERSYPVEADKG